MNHSTKSEQNRKENGFEQFDEQSKTPSRHSSAQNIEPVKDDPIHCNAVLEDHFSLQKAYTNQEKQTGLSRESESMNDEQELQTLQVEIDLFKGIMNMTKSKKITAILGLSGAFCLHLIVGAIYRWNMITDYVSLQYNIDKQTPIGAPLSMLCVGITMRLGYKLSIKFGSKIILWMGLILVTLSTIISSMHTTFQQFLLFHNILFGFSAGLLFLPPIKECHSYFPKWKLVTNSIILTGTGLGAVFFGAYNIQCIEYDSQNLELSQSQLQGLIKSHFTVCMLKMSLILLIVGALGITMMIPMITRNETRQKEERQLSITMTDQKNGNFCKSQLEGLKSQVFWIIAGLVFLISCGNYYIISNFKSLLGSQYDDKSFLYWILICGALGNGISRICWGFLSSRFGFKSLFCVAALFNLISFAAIMISSDETVYIIFYTLNSVSLGGMMVIIPNVSLLVFGKKIGESIYSYYWMVFSFSNFFQYLITLILTNNPTTSGDYSRVLLFFSVSTIASLFICKKYKLQGPWLNSPNLVQFGHKKQ